MSNTVSNRFLPEMLISLATGPLLLGLIGEKLLLNAVKDIGELSEEVFRGDRLPVLDFSSPHAAEET